MRSICRSDDCVRSAEFRRLGCKRYSPATVRCTRIASVALFLAPQPFICRLKQSQVIPLLVPSDNIGVRNVIRVEASFPVALRLSGTGPALGTIHRQHIAVQRRCSPAAEHICRPMAISFDQYAYIGDGYLFQYPDSIPY